MRPGGEAAMARVPVNDKILQRARELIKNDAYGLMRHQAKLSQIVNGKVKTIGAEWWRQVNEVANRRRLDKIKRMTYPKLSPNEGERRAALEILGKLQNTSPPGLEEYDRELEERAAAEGAHSKFQGLFDDFYESLTRKTAEAIKPKSKPESTKQKKGRD
jgi:hypothetical protein